MSMGFNRVMLIGQVQEPKFKWVRDTYAMLEMQLTCERTYRHGDGTDRTETMRVPVVIFGGAAERCQTLTTGTEVVVEGRIKQEQYKNAKGEMRTSFTVVGERCDTCAPGAPPGAPPRADQRAPAPGNLFAGAAA